MSRRSPLNDRYKKGQEPKGMTRKSAASAKPARRNAEPVKKKSSTPAAKKSFREQMNEGLPDTPEYKKLRRAWWAILGVAVVMLIASLVLTTKKFKPIVGQTGQVVSLILSWVALLLVAIAWWVDLKKVRPLMRAWSAGVSVDELKAADAAEKAARKEKAQNRARASVAASQAKKNDKKAEKAQDSKNKEN